MNPLKPPPPNCSTLPFQPVGRLAWKRICGVLTLTGRMPPFTLQYSPTAVGPGGVAGTITAVLITAPRVGRLMFAAGIVLPTRSVQGAGAAVAINACALNAQNAAAVNLDRQVDSMVPSLESGESRNRRCTNKTPSINMRMRAGERYSAQRHRLGARSAAQQATIDAPFRVVSAFLPSTFQARLFCD